MLNGLQNRFTRIFVVALLVLQCSVESAHAQIAAWDFTGASSPATWNTGTFNANLTTASQTLTRGSGAPATAGSNSFRTTSFQNNGISTANTDYFQAAVQAASGYKVSLSSLDATFAGTASFYASPGVTSQFAYSLDGTTFTLIGSPVTTTALTMTTIDLSGVSALQNVPAATKIYLRYYASGQTTTGGWGFISNSGGNGFAIGGSVVLANVPPSFTGGSSQTLTICQNASASSINSLMAITDPNSGQTETWTVTSGPAHGTLGGFPTSATSTGGTVTPTGLTYTPTAGYTGTDAFTIQISDGTATASTTVNLTVNPIPAVSVTPAGGAICPGGSGLSMIASGASTYSWSPSAGLSSTAGATVTATPAATTTYTVAGTASTGCVNTNTVTVTVLSLPGAITGTTSVCQGASGSLSSTPSGGTWASNSTSVATIDAATGVLSGVAAGTAVITYTALTGCYTTAVITVNGLPSATIDGSTTIPTGGSAILTFAGHAGDVVYYWNGTSTVSTTISGSGTSTVTVSPASTTTYSITSATSAQGCSLAVTGQSATVTVSSSPTAGISGGIAICNGQSATLTISGTAGATVYYNNGTATPLSGTLSGTSGVGTFTVAVTPTITTTYSLDSIVAVGYHGSLTESETVTVNPLPTAFAVTGGGSYCTGGSGLAVGLGSSQSSVSYQLYSGATPVGSAVSGTGSAISFGTFTAGATYTVVAANTITGCANNMTGSADISINPLPVAYAVTGSGSYCSGAGGLSLGLANSGTGVNYQLYNGASTAGSAVAGTGAAISFGTFTAAATYTAVGTYTATGCTSNMSGSAVITINPLPTVASITGTPSVAVGGTRILSDATSGGAWSSTNTAVATVGTSGIVTGVAVGTTTISYMVTNGCGTAAATVIVTVNAAPVQIAAWDFYGITSPPTTWTTGNFNSNLTAASNTLTRGAGAAGSAGNNSFRTTGFQNDGIATSNTDYFQATLQARSGYTLSLSSLDAVFNGTNTFYASPGVTSQFAYSLDGATFTLIGSPVQSTSLTMGTVDVSGVTALQNVPSTATVYLRYYASGQTTTGGWGFYSSAAGNYGFTIGGAVVVANTAPSFTGGGSQSLNICQNASATSIDALMAITDANSGQTETWTVVSGPAHGTLGGFPTSATSTGGTVTPTGLSYTPTSGYTGTDAFIVQISDGALTATTTVNVTVNPLPTVSAITGTATVCAGSVTTLANTTSGGSWISGTPSVATVSSTGVVSGITAGTSVITYAVTNGSGCSDLVTSIVTVNALPAINSITGTATVCAGSVTTLSNATSGGSWLSGTPSVATVSSTGIVSGITAGTSVVTYAVTNGSGCSDLVTSIVTVNALPVINSITGIATVCGGSVTTLSNATSGGSWISGTPSVATVSSTGVVSGVASGVANITYAVANGAGCTDKVTATVTVNALPAINSITGTATLCAGSVTTFSNTTTGGSWISGTPSVATITSAGIVNGITAGTSVVTYAVTNGSGCTDLVTSIVTVNALPVINDITGTATVCAGSFTTLSNTTSGGSWISGTPSVATVSSTGIVNGITAGTSVITYAVASGSGCSDQVTSIVTVNALPAVNSITGTAAVCAGSVTTLSNTTSGGSWISGTPSVATITSTGIVNGITAGTSVITYTVTNGSGCTDLVTSIVTVNALPVINSITGTATVCAGSVTTLSNTTSGGSWISGTPSVATITSAGFVSGITAGTSVITYAVTNGSGCADQVTSIVTVNALPVINNITGTATVCAGSFTTLSNTTSGGSWLSGTPSVATITSAGIVSGITAGTSVITYAVTNGSGCSDLVTSIVTVNALPVINDITGTATVCAGSVTTLSNATSGGSWISGTPSVATTTSAGIVSGITAGTSVVTYAATNGSGCSDLVTSIVTVNALPAINSITGIATVCAGSVTTLSNATSGGSWISGTPSVATISSAGVVSGITAGTSAITYAVTNGSGCSDLVTSIVTVNALPVINSITGTATVCGGSVTTLSNTTSGGSWISGTPSVATITSAGIVSGITAGTSAITYAVTNGSGCTSQVTTTVTVNVSPSAILGTFASCSGTTVTLTNATTGGTWSASSSTIATVGATTGVVTAIAQGTVTISYIVNGCAITSVLTVNALPDAGSISGASIVEISSSIAMSASVTGGSWSTGDTTALISSGGVVTGLSAGSATITYTVANSCGSSMTTTMVSIVIPGSETCSLWSTLGTTGYSAGQASYISMARNSSGVLYAAYRDAGNANKVTVVSYNGTTWAGVGAPGISAGEAFYVSIATDATGSPYVAYMEYTNSSKTTVKKFNGSTWVTVGAAGISAGQANYITMAVNGGFPYVAYSDATNANKAILMKFDGSAWAPVGSSAISAGAATGVSLAFDGSNTPYVVYRDGVFGNKATVKKYNGSSWTAVGTEGFSAGNASYTAIAIDAVGAPVIAFRDDNNGGKATVMKYSAGAWSTVGGAGFSAGQANYISMALGSAGLPFVAYRDEANGGKATVMKYNGGAWLPMGAAGFTSGQASFTSIAVDGSDLPVVMYQDAAAGFKATAKKFNSSVAGITGSGYVCVGSSVSLINATTGGSWTSSNPSIASVDAASGVVNGVAAGSATITYTAGPCSTTFVVTVSSPAVAGLISGPSTVVSGGSVTLSATGTGGSWSINNANATVSSSGVVTGVAAGTSVVSYTVSNSCGSAVATYNMTITPALESITGPGSVCGGSSVTLSASAAGGTWVSNNPGIASVDAAGVVTGGSPGVAVITYSLPGGTISTMITVNPLPALITGAGAICQGATLTLSNTTTGGTWSSSTASIAGVSLSGVVTGNAAGTSVISYTLATGCARTAIVTVNAGAGTITGTSGVCVGAMTSLSGAGSGGTWSSSNATIASVSVAGVVTGVAVGNATVTYSLGTCRSITSVNVMSQPANITGTFKACPGTVTTLSDATAGGTWSSANLSVATVDASTGVVSGVSAGAVVISYAAGAGCVKTKEVTINPLPAAISGATSVCVGSATTLNCTSPGGLSWTSSNTAIATVASTGTVIGIAAGQANITFTLGTGCYAIAPVTVNPLPDIIGSSAVCLGGSMTLTSSTPGGTWSSNNTASSTVGLTDGIVNGISATSGYARISYTLPNGCYKTTANITVNALPVDFSGSRMACVGTTTTLTSASGGTWSSSDASVANMASSASGYVQGVSAGTATISYVMSGTGCLRTGVVTVSPMPGAITGTASVCSGVVTTLDNNIAGGTWTSSNTAVATIGSSDGSVTAVGAAGTATITYALTPNCRVTLPFTVKAVPGAIAGTANVCAAFTTTLSSTPSGGAWSSSSTTIATVGTGATSAYGAVTGVAAGTSVVSYTSANGCFRTATVTVNACPRPANPNVQPVTEFKLYPNPTNGLFTFESPVAGELVLYALDGKAVTSYQIDATSVAHTLPSTLATGIYVCRFQGADGSSVIIRLVYEH